MSPTLRNQEPSLRGSKTTIAGAARRAILGGLGCAVLAVGAFAPSAIAAPAPGDDEVQVSLDAPADNLEEVTDERGKRLEIVDIDEAKPDEKTAVALTSGGDPVLLRSLYAPKEQKATSDATEPGLEGWVEGVNYFTDGEPQTSEEKISFSDLPQIDPASLDLAFSTATSSTSFSAAWVDDEKVLYDVYRDGVFVGTADDASFSESGLQPGTDYTYTVLPATREIGGDELTFQVHTLAANAAKLVETTDDPISSLSLQPVASWFLYNTFITNNRVDWDIIQGAFGGCVGTFGDKFGGDNRGYVTPTLYEDPWWYNSHRTGARMKIDFGPNYVIEEKHVGQSHLYNSSGGLKETRTASTSGIVFSERSVSSSLYKVKVSHEVGNPFCSTGAIRYVVYVNTWASGVMQVNGYRHPVPAHEAYGLFMNSSGSEYWQTMYQGAQGDFLCVSGVCPTQTISKTHTPS
ncbi:hypothetical protein [Microbacterium sp. 67-17]|uniref:hypothetical protein n=1 Tax=Microbacterium sp. 67-17 TaxID=1895782 RepID=UPI000A3DE1BC|nr:hypothetical protein [Microbacterium sp. 67-17]